MERMAKQAVRLASPVQRHYFASAFVFGVIFRALTNWLGLYAAGASPLFWVVTFLAFGVLGVVVTSGPLLSYRKSITVSIMASLGCGVCSLGLILQTKTSAPLPNAQLLRGITAVACVFAGFWSLLTCLAVFIRRRYWPV